MKQINDERIVNQNDGGFYFNCESDFVELVKLTANSSGCLYEVVSTYGNNEDSFGYFTNKEKAIACASKEWNRLYPEDKKSIIISVYKYILIRDLDEVNACWTGCDIVKDFMLD